MIEERFFSKDEVSKILSNAARIQAKKDLYNDGQGLTEQELLRVAEEAGINQASVKEAIQSKDFREMHSSFNWLAGSSNIQGVKQIDAEVADENWEEVAHEIRRITGGIGKLNHISKSFEWEQRIKEIGYKHFSFTPQNGSTKVQYVFNWSGLKGLATFLPTFLGMIFTMVALDEKGFSGLSYIILLLLGGTSGFSLGCLFLKAYFERQKSLLKKILAAIGKPLSSYKSSSITIDESTSERAQTSNTSNNTLRDKS